LSGAERRIGFHRFYNEGLYRGDMLTHRVDRQEFHCPDRCTLEQGADVPYSKTIVRDEELTLPVRPLSAAARDRVDAKIRTLAGRDPARLRLVLINANASDMLPQRRWKRERFVKLIRRILAANDDTFVLLTGAPDERPDAEALAAQCASNRCIAFAGHTELADLPALYARAAVSNDSGPAHFAAACGLPTIVLFGPETRIRPRGNSTALYAGLACSPCVSASNHRKSACKVTSAGADLSQTTFT
jgi:ADP-heptose:LPS heptosyltransferase